MLTLALIVVLEQTGIGVTSSLVRILNAHILFIMVLQLPLLYQTMVLAL